VIAPAATPPGAESVVAPVVPSATHQRVLDPLPSDLRAARLAELGAVTGFAALVTLILMFAIEVPSGGPFRFGTTNDLLSAVFSALFIPVAWSVARAMPDGRPGVRGLTLVALGAAAAGTVLPFLLVFGALRFEVQAPLAVACVELQSLWLVVAGRQLARRPGMARFGRLSQVVGASFIAGTAIAGAGVLVPEGPARLALLAVGGIAGAVGWIGWPWWYHAAARSLRRG
jgi:hypothetical protein